MLNQRHRSLLLAAGASLTVLGSAVAWGDDGAQGRANVPALPTGPAGAPQSFAPIIQQVSPAVVSIDIIGHASPSQVAMTQDESPGGQALPFFFGLPDATPRQRPSDGRPLPKIHAAGSGFFISSTGYIVTNNHVVEDADTITAHTADGREYKAHLVGRDPATDIAVVKVDGGPFPFVDFEDSAKPRVGDWVVAVGNPFGLGGTATAGIVSALGREDVADSPLLDYMQIDAPINRGNSGGPTFDTAGRVVGVNTAIFSPSGGSVGIGFDIPAAVASSIAHQLIAKGRVDHGYLGATIQQITPDLAASLGVDTTDGAIIDALATGGPAQRAGLRQGDVVVAVNGKAVRSPTQITRAIAFSSPGDRLDLTVLRDGRTQNLVARAGLRPPEAVLARQVQPQDGGDNSDGG